MNIEEEEHYLGLMDRALDSTSGIAVTCTDQKDAERQRLQMYKIRSAQRSMFGGKSRYDPLILRIDDKQLKIINGTSILDYEVEEL